MVATATAALLQGIGHGLGEDGVVLSNGRSRVEVFQSLLWLGLRVKLGGRGGRTTNRQLQRRRLVERK